MKKRAVRLLSLIFAVVIFIVPFPSPLEAKGRPSCSDILDIASGIIEYERIASGSSHHLLDDKLLCQAGTVAADWYAFAMARMGFELDKAAYIAMAEKNVVDRYNENGSLDPSRATEWHRIILCLLSCGGDPTTIVSEKGIIDLVRDGIYDRGLIAPLDKQGLNGLIWGLIALDSKSYETPTGAHDTREDMISAILSAELDGGGFCLYGSEADVDITAMAITALAPYYHSEASLAAEARDAIDRAISLLSDMQYETGDFASHGTRNLESTCQVAIALCTLGIDPFSDARFVKNGSSVWDGIMRYRRENGGFCHSSSSHSSSDRVANRQALYTMAALYRFCGGMSPLFDLRDEADVSISFDESDAAYADSLPASLTGEYYTRLVTLLYKARFIGNTEYIEKLTCAKAEIEKIRRAVKSLEDRIYDLPSLNELSIFDRSDVLSAFELYASLSEYDKSLVVGAEGLAAAKARVDTLFRALILSVVLSLAVALIVIFIAVGIKRRMTKHDREMEELAAMYESEDDE